MEVYGVLWGFVYGMNGAEAEVLASLTLGLDG